MRKKLFTFLLIIILLASVYVGYFLSKEISTKKVEKISDNEDIISENINENLLSDEDIAKSEENNVIEEQKPEEKTTEVITEKSDISNSSASNNNSSKNTKNGQNKTTTSKPKEEVKTAQETKKEEVKTESNTSKSDEKNGNNEKKLEENSKTIEIIVEEPKKTDYKNDSEYIKMKKELFSSKNECVSKGIDLSFSDSENIASTMCTSESYNGEEVGFRLYIRYKDGTYKEYKK